MFGLGFFFYLFSVYKYFENSKITYREYERITKRFSGERPFRAALRFVFYSVVLFAAGA